jgi:hypothetical protein
VRNQDGSLNGLVVHKLKDKLGTRQLPTAELELVGTRAYLVSKPGRGVGAIAHMVGSAMGTACCGCSSLVYAPRSISREFTTPSARALTFGALSPSRGTTRCGAVRAAAPRSEPAPDPGAAGATLAAGRWRCCRCTKRRWLTWKSSTCVCARQRSVAGSLPAVTACLHGVCLRGHPAARQDRAVWLGQRWGTCAGGSRGDRESAD